MTMKEMWERVQEMFRQPTDFERWTPADVRRTPRILTISARNGITSNTVNPSKLVLTNLLKNGHFLPVFLWLTTMAPFVIVWTVLTNLEI